MAAKYPEVTEYPYLTNAQFEERYPIQADKDGFNALVKQAESEFLDEIVQILQSFSDRDYFFALGEMKAMLESSKGEQAASTEIAALCVDNKIGFGTSMC